MTQEDWNTYIENNTIHLKPTDFIQIVVFQTWWNSNKLNCEIEDVYKKYELAIYDEIVNQNFQLESSPLKSDQPPKTVLSDSSRDSFKTSFQKVTPSKPLTKWEDASVDSHKSAVTPQNFDNNQFVQFMDNDVEDHADVPKNAAVPKNNISSLLTEIRTPKIKNDERSIPSYKQVLLKPENLPDEVQSSPGCLFHRAPML